MPFAVVSPTRFPNVAEVMRGKNFKVGHLHFSLKDVLYFYGAPVNKKSINNLGGAGIAVEPFVLQAETTVDDLTSCLRRATADRGCVDCVLETQSGQQHFAVFKDANLFERLTNG